MLGFRMFLIFNELLKGIPFSLNEMSCASVVGCKFKCHLHIDSYLLNVESILKIESFIIFIGVYPLSTYSECIDRIYESFICSECNAVLNLLSIIQNFLSFYI